MYPANYAEFNIPSKGITGYFDELEIFGENLVLQ